MANAINYIEDATLLARSLGSLVIASPQETEGFTPQDKYESNSIFAKRMFLFDYEDSNEISLESDITDHAVENGDTVGESINNRPEIIQVTGYIGELTSNIKGSLGGDKVNQLKQQARKLIVLGAYSPGLTVTGLSLLRQAEKLYRDAQMMNELATEKWRMLDPSSQNGGIVITGAESQEQLAEKIRAAKNQTYQQKAFQEIYSYWKKKTLFTVRTPYAIFKNCAIQKVTIRQEDGSKHASSFQISFKTFQVASTETEWDLNGGAINPGDSSPILQSQSRAYVEKGMLNVGDVLS